MKLSKRGDRVPRSYRPRHRVRIGMADASDQRARIKRETADQISRTDFHAVEIRGYVASRRGKFGGYSLARPMSRIKFGAVIRLIDGPLAPIRCVSQTSYARCSCPDESSLRATDIDVRRAKRNQHNPGSLYSCRHRRDHASQISTRQSYSAFSCTDRFRLHRCCPKKGARFAASEEPRHAIAFQGREGFDRQHPRNPAVN